MSIYLHPSLKGVALHQRGVLLAAQRPAVPHDAQPEAAHGGAGPGLWRRALPSAPAGGSRRWHAPCCSGAPLPAAEGLEPEEPSGAFRR